MSSRRSPRKHIVHTRHPRYNIKIYNRGKGTLPRGEAGITKYNPYGFYNITIWSADRRSFDEVNLIAKAKYKDDDGLTYGQGLEKLYGDKPILQWRPRKDLTHPYPLGEDEYLLGHSVYYDMGLNGTTVKWLEENLKPLSYRPVKGVDRNGILVYGRNGAALIWGDTFWKTDEMLGVESKMGIKHPPRRQ